MFFPPAFDKSIALEAADLVDQAYDQFEHFKQGMLWILQGNYDTLGLLSAKPEGLLCRKEPFGFVARNKASGGVFVTFGAAPGVFVTGHSLGAGLAVLATADLVNSGVASGAAMYSFAGPRVGDPGFAANFNSRVALAWRIVNTEDIVTTVPFATPELFPDGHPHSAFGIMLMLAHKFDYEHVGNPLSFSAHKGSIPANHGMQVYIDALKAP